MISSESGDSPAPNSSSAKQPSAVVITLSLISAISTLGCAYLASRSPKVLHVEDASPGAINPKPCTPSKASEAVGVSVKWDQTSWQRENYISPLEDIWQEIDVHARDTADATPQAEFHYYIHRKKIAVCHVEYEVELRPGPSREELLFNAINGRIWISSGCPSGVRLQSQGSLRTRDFSSLESVSDNPLLTADNFLFHPQSVTLR